MTLPFGSNGPGRRRPAGSFLVSGLKPRLHPGERASHVRVISARLRQGPRRGRDAAQRPAPVAGPAPSRVRGERFPLTWIFVKSSEFVMPAHKAGREAGWSPARRRCNGAVRHRPAPAVRPRQASPPTERSSQRNPVPASRRADVGGTMHDRVVDRAAAHPAPAELAVRDWLLAGLSFPQECTRRSASWPSGRSSRDFRPGTSCSSGSVSLAPTRPPARTRSRW